MEKLAAREISAVWKAFIWRVVLLGFCGGALLGAAAGFVLTLFHYREWVPLVSVIVGIAWQLAVTRYVIGVVLRRKYRKFSISVIRFKTKEEI